MYSYYYFIDEINEIDEEIKNDRFFLVDFVYVNNITINKIDIEIRNNSYTVK